MRVCDVMCRLVVADAVLGNYAMIMMLMIADEDETCNGILSCKYVAARAFG